MLPSSGFRIGRIFGIDIVINPTWLLILGLFTVSLRDLLIDWPWGGPPFPAGLRSWGIAFLSSLMLFASLLTHELAHSYMAKRSGIEINRITLFIFGGVAEMNEDVKSAGAEFKMAVAGPITTFVLSGLFYLLFLIANAAGAGVTLSRPLASLAWFNVFIGCFNLLPGFPLDGGRVLRSLLWKRSGDLRRATKVTSAMGRVIAVLLCGAGVLSAAGGYSISGLWLILIGVYLYVLAQAVYRQTLFRLAASDTSVRDIMYTNVPVIDSNTRLTDLRNNYFALYRLPAFPVTRDGELVGIVHRGDLSRVSGVEWELLDAGRIARPISSVTTVPPETPLDRVVRPLLRDNEFILVVEGGKVVGAVAKDGLLRYVEARLRKTRRL